MSTNTKTLRSFAKLKNADYIVEKWNSPSTGAAYYRFIPKQSNEKKIRNLAYDPSVKSSEHALEIAKYVSKTWKHYTIQVEENFSKFGKTIYLVYLV